MSGRFIVLEGLDGAGTTTQVAALAQVLRAEGREVLTTREPSNGPIGTLIRQALGKRLQLPDGNPLDRETLALLFAADRVDHLSAEVRPALERGAIVISDRYLLSSLAYQGADLPLPWVAEINKHAMTPHLTLFLDVEVKVAAKRRVVRGAPVELFESDEMQARTAHKYRTAISMRRKAGELVVELDGSKPIADITAHALAEIHKLKLK